MSYIDIVKSLLSYLYSPALIVPPVSSHLTPEKLVLFDALKAAPHEATLVVVPVELAMKLVPTVWDAALTEDVALIKPVIDVLPAASVVIPEAAPAIVKDDPPWMVDVTLANPVIVVLPAASVVIPEAAPAIVSEDPPWILVLTLAKPVVVTPVELAMKLVPTVNNAELTLVLTLAKPVIDVLPAASVVIPEAAPAIVSEDPP